MNQMEKPEQFDLGELRKKFTQAEIRTAPAEQHAAEGGELNEFARRIATQFSESNYSPTMLIGQLRVMDFCFLLAASLAVPYLFTGIDDYGIIANLSIAVCAAACGVVLIQLVDGYLVPMLRAPLRSMPRVLGAWAVASALVALGLFLIGAPEFGFLKWFAYSFGAGAVYLLIERPLLAFGIRRWARNGIMERRAVIVGGGQPAKDLIRTLEQQADNDIRVCGIFDDRGDDRSPAMIAGYPKLGTAAELVAFARLARIDMMIIALPLTAEARILQLLRKLWVLPIDIRLAAHSNSLRFRPRSYSHIGAVPMLDILDKPIRDWDSVAKRCFDIFFSLVALALLWPVMLGVAIAVKATSKGPVLFVQKRHGFNNEVIRVMKFRSMYTEMSDPTARNAVTKNDPRVTPVGRIIRKTSLDELPQFFNVLRGDLSLVGPRPHAVMAQTHDRLYGDVVEGYFARHRVKPGVTGWAQINGWRGEIDNDEKIKFRTAYDLYYIENWSLWFDLKILFLTPIRLLNTENAY